MGLRFFVGDGFPVPQHWKKPISAWCRGTFFGLLVGLWIVLSKASLWWEVARGARRKEEAWQMAQIYSFDLACSGANSLREGAFLCCSFPLSPFHFQFEQDISFPLGFHCGGFFGILRVVYGKKAVLCL